MKTIVALTLLSLATVLPAKETTWRSESTLFHSVGRERYYAKKIHAPPPAAAQAKARYQGIAADVARTGKPLQMINPVAPEEFGTGELNVTRDFTTGRVNGLKLFAVNF